jgi:hypothetical protein
MQQSPRFEQTAVSFFQLILRSEVLSCVNHVSYWLQIYVKTKEYVIMPAKPCMNFASAMKNYGARKLQKVRRFCGGSEPGVSESPDTQEKTCKFQNS